MLVGRRDMLKTACGVLGAVTGGCWPARGNGTGSAAVNVLADWVNTNSVGDGWIDLSAARLFVPEGLSPREGRALTVLLEEVEKRTGLLWERVQRWPTGVPTVAVGTAVTLAPLGNISSPPLPRVTTPEGFAIRIENRGGAPVIALSGADERGVLYGVGKLLRSLRMSKGRVEAPARLEISSSPKYPLRGHQLGYRPKSNSYDGWSVPVWDQYIRELALFGCNFIELIPPRSDDAADSPHFPLPPQQMMVEMSQIADAYGLDVWVWYPAMERDYSDIMTVERELATWGEVFRMLPRLDAVFVPGGDPGHTEPKHLMGLLEKQWHNLRRYHPRGQMWVSPQSFDQAWLDEFLEIVKAEPPWLGGIVFGPQTRIDLPTLRQRVPERYPIRLYPDITHTMECQFPVPDWDVAFSLTEGREPICPRPEAFANIARRYLPYAAGFGTYSEGCNDDVNKFIWNALAWNPESKVEDILRDYSHFFLGDRYAEDFARGLADLEKAWHGPLPNNELVESTLAHFQNLERIASPTELLNWRLQQGLYRAYYDAYVRRRLIYETDLYERAREVLEQVRAVGSHPIALEAGEQREERSTNGFDPAAAIMRAQALLEKAHTQPVAQAERTRIFQLAEALFRSMRMQLSVELYKAEAVDRGGNLDTVDAPLTNGPWLAERLREIGALPNRGDQVRALEDLLDRTNPGASGFYDELGDPARSPHLVRGPGAAEDPEMRRSALIGHDSPLPAAFPLAWKRWAEALYDAPLRMHYAKLDPSARYKVRVVYAGDEPEVKVRLACEDGPEIHPFISKPQPPSPLEFDIPPEVTARGELTLVWTRPPGLGGNGRGAQVAEVWLLPRGNTP